MEAIAVYILTSWRALRLAFIRVLVRVSRLRRNQRLLQLHLFIEGLSKAPPMRRGLAYKRSGTNPENKIFSRGHVWRVKQVLSALTTLMRYEVI